MLTIVGQGLAGTLVAFNAEKRGQSFIIVDEGSGLTASRAAAGLFNPLTGPRFTPSRQDWRQIASLYKDIETTLGAKILHQMTIMRSLEGAKVESGIFPQSAAGWSAELCPHEGKQFVRIEGGGWLDIHTLLDLSRTRWLKEGKLEERIFDPNEGLDSTIVWCGGFRDLIGPQWSSVPSVAGSWQPVRGDVLVVRIPNFELNHIEIGSKFLLPLENSLFRWGATHESDIASLEFRPKALLDLEESLRARLGGKRFEILSHRWGIRPASRNQIPLVIRHPDHPNWILFNGFGGRGVATIPNWLDKLIY